MTPIPVSLNTLQRSVRASGTVTFSIPHSILGPLILENEGSIDSSLLVSYDHEKIRVAWAEKIILSDSQNKTKQKSG